MEKERRPDAFVNLATLHAHITKAIEDFAAGKPKFEFIDLLKHLAVQAPHFLPLEQESELKRIMGSSNLSGSKSASLFAVYLCSRTLLTAAAPRLTGNKKEDSGLLSDLVIELAEYLREYAPGSNTSIKHDISNKTRDRIKEIRSNEGIVEFGLEDRRPDERFGEGFDAWLLRGDMVSMLKTIRPNRERVLKLRYGIKPKSYTFEEMLRLGEETYNEERTLLDLAEASDLTRERIRQIEQKGLKELRHPSRSRVLSIHAYKGRGYYRDEPEPQRKWQFDTDEFTPKLAVAGARRLERLGFYETAAIWRVRASKLYLSEYSIVRAKIEMLQAARLFKLEELKYKQMITKRNDKIFGRIADELGMDADECMQLYHSYGTSEVAEPVHYKSYYQLMAIINDEFKKLKRL